MKGSRPLTKSECARLRQLFRGRWKVRNLAMFVVGSNTGFRITELLSLTIGDVLEATGEIKERVVVARRNMKRKRASRSVLLNSTAKNALSPWLRELARREYVQKTDFLFQSQAAQNRAISRESAWRILDTAYKIGGIKGKLGTHAMRKTFANTVYKHFLDRAANGEPVDPFRATSKALDHENINSTDKYLSFLTEDVDLAIDSIEI